MHNDNEEFDRIVRSMMQDAEEEVPSGMWESVSSRLDGAGSKKTVVIRWRRAVAAVAAVAAAVVAGVVLFPDKPANDIEVVPRTAQSITEPDADKAPEQSVAEKAEPSKTIIVSSLLAESDEPEESAAVPEIIETTPADLAIVSESVEETVAEEEKAEETAVQAVPQETKPSPKPSAKPEEDSSFKEDPFAKLEREEKEAQEREKVSFTVGGDVASNGDPASMHRFNIFRAGANGYAKTGVQQVGKESSYEIPLSLGLGVRIPIYRKISLGTGVNFSMLGRTFSGIYTEAKDGIAVRTINSDIHSTLYYVGIPVNVFYDILSGKRFSFYAYGGGTIEKGLSNRYVVSHSPVDIHYNESVGGVQLSAGAGFGVAFKLSDKFSIYMDPGFRYWFDCDQPVSIRTQQPFMMSYEIGLRFGL